MTSDIAPAACRPGTCTRPGGDCRYLGLARPAAGAAVPARDVLPAQVRGR